MFLPSWLFWLLTSCSGISIALHLKTIMYLNDEKNKKKGVTVTAITNTIFYLILAIVVMFFPLYLIFIRL